MRILMANKCVKMLKLTSSQGNADKSNDAALLSLFGRHEKIRISQTGEMCGDWDSEHCGDSVDGCRYPGAVPPNEWQEPACALWLALSFLGEHPREVLKEGFTREFSQWYFCFCFLWYWGLNPGPCARWASALSSTELHPHPPPSDIYGSNELEANNMIMDCQGSG